MPKNFSVALAWMIGLAFCTGNVFAQPLRYGVVDRIPGPDGAYDYISVDSHAQRLFVGRENGVMAVDIATHQLTSAFVDGEGVASVLLLADGTQALSTNRAGDTATLFDRRNGKVLSVLRMGKGPDGALLDRFSGLVFVFNSGSADATLIDVAKRAVVGTISLGGKPEASVEDGNGRVYVNIEDRADIAVIDTRTRKLVKRLALQECVEPTGLAFDAETNVLISACSNGIAVLIDAGSGQSLRNVPVGRKADGVIFDAQRRIAYVPCGDGTLTIFRLDKQRKASEIVSIPTQEGARTAALDQASGRLYLPAVHYLFGSDGKRKRAPGTFAVLVVSSLDDLH